MKAAIHSWDSKSTGQLELDDRVFALAPERTLLNLVVRWQRARARAGTHKTKELSDVRGSTRKPHKQKGTGRARAGSIRVAHWRGGATVFGPRVRSHGFKLPKKMVSLALAQALSDKAANDQLVVVDKAQAETPKVAGMKKKIEKLLGTTGTNLIIDTTIDDNFRLSTRNISKVDVLPVGGANVYDILRHDRLVLTVAAVEALSARLTKARKGRGEADHG
ncbi:MAG: 50S ribosomal protein L4 [Pseudomonadota bacterium]